MVEHPAKYSDAFLPIFRDKLEGYGRVLDPFAGTGKLKIVRPDAVLLEIEPEWAKINRAIVGDALAMPFRDNAFDAVCTSPTYGNRMADNFECRKGYKRNTYRSKLGRELSENNSGKLQWGEKYRKFHEDAWKECGRILKDGGRFVLNISDHIRKGERIFVTYWHLKVLGSLNFEVVEHIKVETKRNRFGANSELRVPYESIVIFRKI